MAFSSLSAMRPATMPPTTPVMVSMNMKRAVIWAKVFSPKKALSTPPVWCQSAWPGQSMKERMPTITRSVATDASPKMIEMRVDALIMIGGKVDEMVSDEEYVEKINQITDTIPV